MYYTEEDILQTCLLIQLEKGDVITNQRVLRLEALDRLNPRRYDRTKGRREDRHIKYNSRGDRRITKEDMLLSLIFRLYKIQDNKLYMDILNYIFLEGLTYIEVSKKLHISRHSVANIVNRIMNILS